jgi:hypothetical protein
MEYQVTVHPFGEIKSAEGTATSTTISNWQQLSEFWKIKMYQTRPGSHESVEMSSITLLAEELWPPLRDVYAEFEEWDTLSDEAFLDFEASLD